MRDGGLPEPAASSPGSIADAGAVRAILVAAARNGRAVSYSEVLGDLGHRFTRPKMRALCATLEAVDQDCASRGEPDMAVLVVRESDRLPGQGWWVGGTALSRGYAGAWEGADALKFVRTLQKEVFAWWKAHPDGGAHPATD